MKILPKLGALFFLSIAANATTVFIASSALSTTNSSMDETVNLAGALHPNPVWAAAMPGSHWISYGPTGDHDDVGYFSPANGTLVTFTTHFILSGLITGGQLAVMADDSTSVVLNGHTLLAISKKEGPACAKVPIGCLSSTEGVFDFAALSPYLMDGANTLSFGVLQIHRSSFGLDFAGRVDTSQTPEPATFAVIGGGLIALAILRRRK